MMRLPDSAIWRYSVLASKKFFSISVWQMMNKNPYKTVNVQESTHRLLKIESAHTGIQIMDLIDAAWAAYERQKDAEELPLSDAGIAEYRPENRPWHHVLEKALNDPREGAAVRRVLGWVRQAMERETGG